jgi:hypothetical protein
MLSAEMRRLTLELSADLRAGRFVADLDLGKSEYLGVSQDMAAAFEARARPILEAFLARGLITQEEFDARMTLEGDRDILADQLQALAETLLIE